jgi:hypothetical protein
VRARQVTCVVLLAAAVIATGSPAAHGAELPAQWCGTDEVSANRPDVVMGDQIQVVYMVAAEQPDRFFEYAPLIAREIAAVDAWWRTQDPTRSPRFDLAAFPGCTSEFGSLDILSLTLPPGADTAVAGVVSAVVEVLRQNTISSSEKKFLVFLDGQAPEMVCGYSRGYEELSGPYLPAVVYLGGGQGCGLELFGSGVGVPTVVVAHELVHNINAGGLSWPAPNVCSDRGHVCDAGFDVLATGEAGTTDRIDQRLLDVNHDDYYAHAGPWWDVQDSSWLRHLDEPSARVHVRVSGDGPATGMVQVAATTTVCLDVCDWSHDGRLSTLLYAIPRASSRFVEWSGACTGKDKSCSIEIDGEMEVKAQFESAFDLDASIGRGGMVAAKGFDECSTRCTMRLPAARVVTLVARTRPGYAFVQWRGMCKGTNPKCRLNRRGDVEARDVFAEFERAS